MPWAGQTSRVIAGIDHVAGLPRCAPILRAIRSIDVIGNLQRSQSLAAHIEDGDIYVHVALRQIDLFFERQFLAGGVLGGLIA